MVEVIGVVSGLAGLTALAVETSASLNELVKSYQRHPKTVRELMQVLEALRGVLNPLAETLKTATEVDLSALRFPLERCIEACTEFEKEIRKCSLRSGGDRTSFRDWAKLRYMGGNIDGFRQLLDGYKMTIGIALTHANLYIHYSTPEFRTGLTCPHSRKSSQTAESLEDHKISLKEAKDDLEDHLLNIDEKLEAIIGRIVPDTDEDITELRRIREERISTEKGLEICAQLSYHIDKIQSTLKQSGRPPGSVKPSALSERVVNEGVQGCKDSMNLASEKLKRNLRDTMDRLIKKSKTAMSSKEEAAELARVWNEWEAASKCKEFYSKEENYLNESISIIENCSAGNSVQYLVSTDGTVIHGKNQDEGGGAFQCGGHIDSATLQAIVRKMPSISNGPPKNQRPPLRSNIHPTQDSAMEKEEFSKFSQYGRGFKLSLDSTPDTTDPSICLVDSSPVDSQKS